MQKGFKKGLVTVMLLLLAAVSCFAALPRPVGYVNDFANVISGDHRRQMEDAAIALRDDQGVELAVVTIRSSSPLTPKDYATQLFNEWGIGGPKDSGLLILLSVDDREIQVEVGYGLEGVLPDGKVGAILDQAVVPHLAKGEYGRGLLAGAKVFKAELAGEHYELDTRDNEWPIAFIIFILIAVIVSYLSRRKGPKGPGGTVRRPRPVPVPRSPHRPSGGGFGGFGGGRSGGGGAGRKF
ncbi:MAG: TPM domain-containing protein [Limnochordia bacterium]